MDEGVARSHPSLNEKVLQYFTHHRDLHLVASPVLIPGGEVSKTNESIFKQNIEILSETKLCRHSFVLVIGGGAVLDSVCFAASLVHRGIRQIRIPTTVLAQSDAGIGIKNGIDYKGKKNFLGTFQPPFAVINDSEFLNTLPNEHWRSGMAEAIKVALIRDREFFYWIEEQQTSLHKRELEPMKKLIFRGAQLHLEHISTAGDPFERGSARPLDFGHWSAHKLEQLSDFTVTHGSAVAIGMALDCLYANEVGLLNLRDCMRVIACLKNLGFELWHPKLSLLKKGTDTLAIFDGLVEFQEHLGGILSIPLLTGIGSKTEIHQIEIEKYIKSLTRLQGLETTRSKETLGVPPSIT